MQIDYETRHQWQAHWHLSGGGVNVIQEGEQSSVKGISIYFGIALWGGGGEPPSVYHCKTPLIVIEYKSKNTMIPSGYQCNLNASKKTICCYYATTYDEGRGVTPF